MSLDSCDHNNFIVIYDVAKDFTCPVCDLEDEIKSLEEKIEILEEQND